MGNPFDRPTAPTAPTPTPAARMPDPDDPAVREAKRREIGEALSRSGRGATILTGRPRARSTGGGITDSFNSSTL